MVDKHSTSTDSFGFIVAVNADPNSPYYGVEPTNHDLWVQSGANQNQGHFIPRFDARAPALGVAGVNITTPAAANAALGAIDRAMGRVSSFRAAVGAHINRLESTTNSLSISYNNLSDAQSRVRDADMAREMMANTMANILQQASLSMLAQSRSQQENILQLLR
jgi:flagellin